MAEIGHGLSDLLQAYWASLTFLAILRQKHRKEASAIRRRDSSWHAGAQWETMAGKPWPIKWSSSAGQDS